MKIARKCGEAWIRLWEGPMLSRRRNHANLGAPEPIAAKGVSKSAQRKRSSEFQSSLRLQGVFRNRTDVAMSAYARHGVNTMIAVAIGFITASVMSPAPSVWSKAFQDAPPDHASLYNHLQQPLDVGLTVKAVAELSSNTSRLHIVPAGTAGKPLRSGRPQVVNRFPTPARLRFLTCVMRTFCVFHCTSP
jgi:hypothetical protein